MAPKHPRSQSLSNSDRDGNRVANELRLLPWRDVRAIYNKENGERLSLQAVRTIGLKAERKLRYRLTTLLTEIK